MVKILSCIYFPHQAKDFICSVTKPLENTTEHLTNSAMEISRQASEAVTSTQKALLSINERPRLNLDSEAVEFFGLKSYEDMAFKNGEELLTKFKMEELACKSLIPENASEGLRKGSKLFRLFDELSPDCGCARMTFYDRCFGGAMHTICLQSLDFCQY